MATRIARVTQDLSEERGPDVIHHISVPRAWLQGGAAVSVVLPRLLSCARCQGGGCDDCERRGALAVRERETQQAISVRLAAGLPDQAQLIRIPEHGAKAQNPDWPQGCLLLRVEPGECSKGVRTLECVPESSQTPVQFSKMWLLLPVLTAAVWWGLQNFVR